MRLAAAVVLVAAAAVWSLVGPARIGSALKEGLAQWWSIAWDALKEEGSQVLPTMRSRLQDDPDLARYWLGQGLPGAVHEDPVVPHSWAEWEQEVRRLMARVADYDADDPKALLARHLVGGPAPGPSLAPPAPATPPALPAEVADPGSADPGSPDSGSGSVERAALPEPSTPAGAGGVPSLQPVAWPASPMPEPRPLPPSLAPPGGGGAGGVSPGSPGGGAAGPGGEWTVGRDGVPAHPWMAAVRRSVSWGEGPLVAIYHSHTSEMYRTDDFFPPHPDDYHRFSTPDTGIVKVGEALAERLRAYGIGVVHNRRVHDSPVHALAYRRSRETVQEMLERFPTLEIILDVHRDAPEGLTAVVAGQTVGQVMLLVGRGEQARGLSNPHWERNLALARELEEVMTQRFPGLHRRTWVRADARFNQDLHPGMLLIEIGSYDTHLDEALAAARMVGDAVAEALWRRRAGGPQGIGAP